VIPDDAPLYRLVGWLANDMLVKVDCMSMANALEIRCPLLDHRIIEFGASLPSDLKYRGRVSKYLLKRHLDGRVPASAIHRRKQGFEIPLARWLRGDLHDLAHDMLFSRRALGRGHIRPERLRLLWDRHQRGVRDHSAQIWTVKTFEDEWRARFERFARKHGDEAAVSGWSESGLRRRVRCFSSLVPGRNRGAPGPGPA
jgi:asparagine synthase (glutamine-hydrolysing)